MKNFKACKLWSKRRKMMMSKLPDEILIDILSRLSIKEAARTSLVSRQWKSLWKFYAGSLDFDCDSETIVLLSNGKKRFVIEQPKFIDWVNQVLDALHQARTIEQFRVCFDLGKDHTSTIDSWIGYAAARKVRRLELSLPSMFAKDKKCKFFKYLREIYNFPTPDQLMNKNNNLRNLKSLISLRLESVNVTDKHVSYFLSEFPFLEELSMADAPYLRNLKVVGGGGGQSLKLKHLELRYCMDLRNLEVTAAASNLASFIYAGPMINMIFQDVPQLSSVSLYSGNYWDVLVRDGFEGLPFPVLQLQMLTLDFGWMMSCYKFTCPEFPKLFPKLFPSLRQLELVLWMLDEGTVLFVASFLRASPYLHKLVLKCKIHPYHTVLMKKEDPKLELFHQELAKKGCKFECLKEVEFLGWNGLKRDVEFVTHLIEASGSLERVTFDPCDPFRVGIMKGLPLSPDVVANEEDARNRARDLESRLSPRTKLVVAPKCHCC